MKIAHICLDNINVAIAQSYIVKKYGVESTILIPKTAINDVADIIHYGFGSGNPFGIKIKYLSDNSIIRNIQVFLENNSYDIIHLHDGAGVFTAFFCGYGKAKILYQFHGTSIRSGVPTYRLLTRTRKFLWKHVGIYEKAVVSTPDILKDWEGSELLLDPIDPTIYAIKRKEPKKYIVSSHWCNDNIKGTNKVFDAWDIFKQKYPDYTLAVIKWGVDLGKYMERTKNDASVIWYEPMKHQTFLEFISEATMCWGQFKLSAFGLTEMECMAIGVPTVTGSGLSFEDISRTSCRIIEDEKYKLNGLDNQNHILKKYSEEILSKQLYEIYSNMLNKKRNIYK